MSVRSQPDIFGVSCGVGAALWTGVDGGAKKERYALILILKEGDDPHLDALAVGRLCG